MQTSSMNFHFGHSRTYSRLELAVGSVVDMAVDGGYSESTDSHTELPEDVAIQQ